MVGFEFSTWFLCFFWLDCVNFMITESMYVFEYVCIYVYSFNVYRQRYVYNHMSFSAYRYRHAYVRVPPEPKTLKIVGPFLKPWLL